MIISQIYSTTATPFFFFWFFFEQVYFSGGSVFSVQEIDFYVPVQGLNVFQGRWSAAAQVPGLCDCEANGSDCQLCPTRCKAKRVLSTPHDHFMSAISLPHLFFCIWISKYCSCTAMFYPKWWNKSGKCICFNLLFSSLIIKRWPQYWNLLPVDLLSIDISQWDMKLVLYTFCEEKN